MCIRDRSGAAATGDTLESEVLGKLGLQNTASELSGYALSDEQLAGMDPDWLICDDGITAEALAASRYASLPAVQEGRVLYVDGAPFEMCIRDSSGCSGRGNACRHTPRLCSGCSM